MLLALLPSFTTLVFVRFTMANLIAAPYGTWDSPISADVITEGAKVIAGITVDEATRSIYHVESRASEKGRGVIVNTKSGKDFTDGKDWSVRTGVHEYGGAAYVVFKSVAYFSHFGDSRVYSCKEGGEPLPVTPVNPLHRFANLAVHPTQPHLIVAILEDHTTDIPSEIINTLCLINTKTQMVTSVISGADFYAAPTFSPDGSKLAYQTWGHPDMSWEGGEIHIRDVALSEDGLSLSNDVHVAGKKSTVSAAYPQWASNDTLVFTSDESGYQNPYFFKGGKVSALLPESIPSDFSEPAWMLGDSPYAILGERAVFAAIEGGRFVLYVVSLVGAAPVKLDAPYVVVRWIRALNENQAVFLADKADESGSVVIMTLNGTNPSFETLSSSASPASKFPKDLVSIPQPISFKVPPNDEPLHVVYYAPKNTAYSGTSIAGERPPCVVNVHGGPTALQSQALNWSKQYYTSRGWGWLDVNYGGSAGYGRKYTDRLAGTWGVVDVEDCILAAQSLAAAPYSLIDPKRTVIRGGSAGGYTTLSALSTAKDVNVFAAGTSSYGISDLKKLVEEIHKFESRYLYKLIGGTPEEVPNLYVEKSPIFHAERIISPLLILQGEIDRVVPKEQAEAIVKTMEERGARVEYKLYEGEAHGWRQAHTMIDALEREIRFYEDVLQLKK